MAHEITIDDLAAMVKRGFDSMDKRFDAVDKRSDQMATKDDLHALEQKVDAGFAHMNARLDTIRSDISDLPSIREELYDVRHPSRAT